MRGWSRYWEGSRLKGLRALLWCLVVGHDDGGISYNYIYWDDKAGYECVRCHVSVDRLSGGVKP